MQTQPRLSIEQAKVWVSQNALPHDLVSDCNWKMLSGFPHRINGRAVVHFIQDAQGRINCRNGYVN